MKFTHSVIAFFALLLSASSGAETVTPGALKQPVIRYDSIHHPVIGYHGMVVSQRETASQVGAQILESGGNAIDAAVAVGFALAVVLPRAGNLGGGGFMMIRSADGEVSVAIDFREMAPAAAGRDTYLDSEGNVDKNSIRFSHRASGVPGSVAGLVHAQKRFGTLPLATVMAPAIELADQGFEMTSDTAAAIVRREKRLRGHAYTESLFFRPDKTPYQAGDNFRQPELAETLRRIATEGPDVFYRGDIAELIVAEMQRGNGLITMADMAAYRVVEREPISGTYKGYRVLSMPPPSSGGIHLVQLLNVLEYFPLNELGHNSAATIHIMAEAMKYAYADRSEYLGDPDYYPVPVSWLTDKGYAGQIAKKIEPRRARPSSEIAPGQLPAAESPDTTHYSVIDADGNAVATTYTLNFSFGSGISVPGAGFLLNNEMADFSAKPGVPNAFGLLGNEANAVEGGKRPLSAMTPTIVLRDGKPYLVTGTPGGSRIITSVLQHVVNVLEFDMNVAAANHASRIHHQWYPDKLLYETGIGPDTLKLLSSFGQNVQHTNTMGSVQAIVFDSERFQGSDDPRRPDAGAVAVQR